MSLDLFYSLHPWLFLLSCNLFSALVFVFYLLYARKRKKGKIYVYDFAIWVIPGLAWFAGFVLCDKYGIGFGKSLANLSEIFYIGLLIYLYVAIRIICVEWLKRCRGDSWVRHLFFSIVLLAFAIGMFWPGIPE